MEVMSGLLKAPNVARVEQETRGDGLPLCIVCQSFDSQITFKLKVHLGLSTGIQVTILAEVSLLPCWRKLALIIHLLNYVTQWHCFEQWESSWTGDFQDPWNPRCSFSKWDACRAHIKAMGWHWLKMNNPGPYHQIHQIRSPEAVVWYDTFFYQDDFRLIKSWEPLNWVVGWRDRENIRKEVLKTHERIVSEFPSQNQANLRIWTNKC